MFDFFEKLKYNKLTIVKHGRIPSVKEQVAELALFIFATNGKIYKRFTLGKTSLSMKGGIFNHENISNRYSFLFSCKKLILK